MDAGDILQESTAAAGQQIDLTFNGFVLDNGPGQTNINLRGLGGGRTLVLINGRRVAPAGVEGAPTSPDLGLVPSSLVQQYDLLLFSESFQYIPLPDVFARAPGLLRSGGRLVICDFFKTSDHPQ